MKKYLAIASVIIALCGTIYYERRILTGLRAELNRANEELGRQHEKSAALRAALETMQGLSAINEAVTGSAVRRANDLAARSRELQHRLKEAMLHAASTDPEENLYALPLPYAAADALCLRHHAAGLAAGTPAAPASAPGPHTAQKHTAAPGAGEPDCAAWRGLTIGETVEWAGVLLEHAGLEGNDKNALREWAGRAAIEEN